MNLRLPNITGVTPQEQLAQIRSYLYQLVPDLQYALSGVSVDTTAHSGASEMLLPSGSLAQSTFNALKPYIIQSTDIYKAYYDMLPDAIKKRGETDGWRWCIWRDGGLEASASKVFTLTADSTAYGAMHRSETFTIPLHDKVDASTVIVLCTGEDAIVETEKSDGGIALHFVTAEEKAVGDKVKASIHIQAKLKKEEGKE
jgi:hypothetical protein